MASFAFSTYSTGDEDLSDGDWERLLFSKIDEEPALGSRLGVDYMRTQEEKVVVNAHSTHSDSDCRLTITVNQFSSGDNGISGAVWDAGLLLVDYLCQYPVNAWLGKEKVSHTNVLDLGCGTGVIGLTVAAIIEEAVPSSKAAGQEIDACVWFSDKESVREGLMANMISNMNFVSPKEKSCMDASSSRGASGKGEGEEDLDKLLATMSPVLDTDCYYRFATISVAKKLKISGEAATSPAYSRYLNTLVLSTGVTPLCTFMEKEGFTVIVSNSHSLKLMELDKKYINDIEGQIRVQIATGDFARITLEVHSSLDAVGLTAAVSTALTRANISVNIVAGYFHDHIFIQEQRALEAIAELRRLSEIDANKSATPPESTFCKKEFLSHDWQEQNSDSSLIFERPYSLVTCGDVLYDSTLHSPLLLILEKLRFGTLLIGYKKRHADKEREFFTALAAFCDLRVVVGGIEEEEHQRNKVDQSNLYRIGGSKSTAEVGKTLFVVEAKRKSKSIV